MTKKKGIITVGLILLAVIATTLLYYSESPGSQEAGTSSTQKQADIALNVYTIDNGWAYKILINNSTFIVQEQIPGAPGDKTFQSKSDAKKCGELVVEKLKKRIIPSVTKDELDSLGINY